MYLLVCCRDQKLLSWSSRLELTSAAVSLTRRPRPPTQASCKRMKLPGTLDWIIFRSQRPTSMRWQIPGVMLPIAPPSSSWGSLRRHRIAPPSMSANRHPQVRLGELRRSLSALLCNAIA